MSRRPFALIVAGWLLTTIGVAFAAAQLSVLQITEGSVVIESPGPHMVGLPTANPGAQWEWNGTFRGPTTSRALHLVTTVLGNDGYGVIGASFGPTLIPASTGSHYGAGALNVGAAFIPGQGGASIGIAYSIRAAGFAAPVNTARAATLYIESGTSGATKNHALRINNGDVSLGNTVIQGEEVAEPAAPGANEFVLFGRDDGAGRTQVCAKFANNAVTCFASQ